VKYRTIVADRASDFSDIAEGARALLAGDIARAESIASGRHYYRTIVADPPWAYSTTKPSARWHRFITAESHYDTMTNKQIASLPVADLAAPNAHLYLWVTNPRLFRGRKDDGVGPIEIVEAWGFRYQTLITWVKEGTLGMGWDVRGQTEHAIFATRGDAKIPAEKRERNIIHAPKGRHSEKPDAFMDMVERVSPEPRIELFSRRARFGWDTWGDEALNHVSLESA
jgi:N6-adenosine-specific RNA methylase IME4